MSRSRDLSSSSTDSDDDFQLQKQNKSSLERPASDLKKATTVLSTSDDDERPTPVKQPLKSASSTSIASKIKNIFRSSKQDKKKPTRKSPAKSDTETEESRSIERSIKNVLKSQTSVVTKPSELDRPSTRLDINSTSSTTTTSETDRSLDSDRTEKDGVSTDTDSPSRLTKKASSASSSSDDGSDTEREHQPVPIRVKIEKKPPIDKSKWKLDRPDSDSATSDSTQRSCVVEKTKANKKERSRFLGKTFDLNSDDSASSGNEMTDVSPLATPKDTGKLSMNVFYKALETDELRVDSYGNKMAKRNSSAKSGPGCLQKSRSCDNDYEYKSNCHNSIDFESFGFKMRPVEGGSMLRPGDTSASKRGYNKLLDQSLANSPYTKVQRPFRVTSSALNRQREQQRIERENQVSSEF